MRSFAALAILAAFSHCALGAEDFAFTYRGCINGTSIPNRVDVQFALYEKATGGSPLWSTTNSVMPSADGVFQCELAGEGLAAAFTNANARFIGVRIGNEAELYPRQEVFAAPLVDQAESAASLAPNGSAERVYVTNLCAQTMSLGWLDLYGNLVFTKPTSSLTLTDARNWDGSTLILKLVTVMSASSSDWDRADSVPCVTWAVSPGNIYPPFSVGHPVKVYFYPFGTAN